MSQVGLAEVLGSHAQSLWQIERGVRGVTVQQIVRLARALKVPTDEILGEGRHTTALTALQNGTRPFLRRLRRIQALPVLQQRILLKLLDSALDMHEGGMPRASQSSPVAPERVTRVRVPAKRSRTHSTKRV
jgi:transcriptional regulator with XRE-family HTH domain